MGSYGMLNFEINTKTRYFIEKNTKEMNWISVKDRLPENTDEVLVYFIGWDDLQFQSVMYLENGDWYNEDGDPCYAVTHWMPLPEPPNN